jgi:hypothetical protein
MVEFRMSAHKHYLSRCSEATGMDIAVFEDGKIKSLYAFFDKKLKR